MVLKNVKNKKNKQIPFKMEKGWKHGGCKHCKGGFGG